MMTNEIIIIIALLVIQLITLVLNQREKKDLLDRIMANSLVEYKDNQKPEDNKFPEEDPNLINLDEAKEELNG